MKVLLTGTGAADGIPAFFADSRVSRAARENGGKDRRLRSAAVIDGILRVDFGPDTFAQAVLLGLQPRDWQYIVYTHSHDDHFAPRELQYVFPPFVSVESETPEVFGNQAILDGIEGSFEEAGHVVCSLLESFVPTRIGPYEVTPIKAYHKLDEDSLNLIISTDKTLLYATDTGIWQPDTWSFLEGWRFDGAVIECTDGFNPTEYWGHLSCEELVGVVARLRQMGCLANGAPIVTTHHSATGDGTHEELERYLGPHGISVGYDGLAIHL